VQLPFLQVILSNFQILPILINNENQSKKLAEILNSILDKETLFNN
jgi:AmmeMemoRadiSam system protein B